jgi:hypothetical protein
MNPREGFRDRFPQTKLCRRKLTKWATSRRLHKEMHKTYCGFDNCQMKIRVPLENTNVRNMEVVIIQARNAKTYSPGSSSAALAKIRFSLCAFASRELFR